MADINTQLYNKMEAEQKQYRDWLLGLSPEKILDHTNEYTVRNEILMAVFNYGALSDAKLEALMSSSTPLADVVKEYLNMEDERMDMALAAVDSRAEYVIQEARNKPLTPPIYPHSAAYAIEHGERDAYFASKKAYEDCKKAIEESITRHHDGYFFSDGLVQDVMQRFSVERVKNVLAYTVQKKDWDGRFSRSNKEWAQGVQTGISEPLGIYFVVESHPALLDGFISMFRREVLERSTSEKSTEKPQHKPKERSDDLEL